MKLTWRIVSRTLVIAFGAIYMEAAVIPKLYNTGVDDTGSPLADSTMDTHYKITDSPDPDAPGPDTFTLTPGFPVGPWLAEGPNSRWIAPSPTQGTGNAEGNYTYEITFDLTGLDPATAVINGQWATDNDGVDIVINGNSLGLINSAQFVSWTAFTIDSGFIDGKNTLQFVVHNAPDTPNPTGLRVEMTGRATSPTEKPSIITPPPSQTVIAGDIVHFTAEAAGAAPLTYQWNFKGNPITGATGAAYTITSAKTTDTGDYTLTVKNTFGEATSAAATLTVLEPFPGIYNTGVNDSRAVLDDGSPDTHYKLVLNPNDPSTTTPVVEDSTLFPIVAGPWIANSDKSKWIAPMVDTTTAAPGDYTYELDLDLTGYDPATAFIAGSWATDNAGSLFLNGADTGFTSPNLDSFSTFNITNGFISGMNKLEFRVNNAGTAVGWTGLRVENLRGTATKSTAGQTAPKIVTQPKGGTKVMTDKITLTVVADGTPPLTFQWSHNGVEIPGATSPSYAIAPILPNDSGTYSVKVSNALGSATSDTVQLNVIQPDTGVFNTGVDGSGAPLPVGQFDTHYVLLANPDSAHPGILPYAIANHPAWVANDEDSQWISPSAARDDVAPGNYQYRLIFEIPAKDVATAAISGSFATDDGSGGIFLNGTQVNNAGGGFGGLASLDIPAGSGFVAGLNTLDFFVNNGGTAANPSGLRVDDMTLTGVTYDPEINLQPQDVTLVEGSDLSLAVGVVSHTTPITFQWQFNGKNIPGATSATLTTSNVTLSAAGNYTAIVTSPSGTASSRTAVVKILAVPGAARQGGSGADGLVVLEAEDYNQKIPGTPAGATAEINWTKITDPTGFSGTGAMEPLPNNTVTPVNVNIDISASPRMDYKVKFEKAGTYNVWVRGLGDSGTGNPSANDSVNVGLDLTLPSTSDRISVFTQGAGYIWSNGLGDGSLDNVPATFDVSTPGLHVVNVWMREDGFIFDKLLLTLDDTFTPTDLGPAESPLVGGAQQAHLTVSQSNGTITIAWDQPGALESADQVNGPYNPVSGVTGQSYQTPSNAAAKKFYRVN
jgi:hypothetical protein